MARDSQDRFSGAIQYLKAGRKFGLLSFEGEPLLFGAASLVVRSPSLGKTRAEMLAGCLERPRLLAAMLDASRLGELLQQPRMQAKMDEFCRETFEDTFYSA
jgi:hypothetical protein